MKKCHLISNGWYSGMVKSIFTIVSYLMAGTQERLNRFLPLLVIDFVHILRMC